jgi:hypothetical protein
MVQTYALEAYKINKTGDLQIRWTQVQEYLLQPLGKVPTTHTPKHPHGGMLKKERKVLKPLENRQNLRLFAE